MSELAISGLSGQAMTHAAPVTDAATAPTNEVTTAAAPVTTPASEPEKKETATASQALALAARNQKRAMQMARQAKAREQMLAEKEAKLKAQEEIFAKGKTNPIEALQLMGWSYKDATDFVLNNQQPTAEKSVAQVKNELEEFKKAQEEKERLATENAAKAAQAEYAEVIEDFKSQVYSYVDSNPDSCELVKLFNAQDMVFATIQEYFNTNKKIMSIEDAAPLVEEYLEGEAQKALSTKKLSSKYKAATEAKSEPAKAEPPRSSTLNNNMVSSAAPSLLSAKTEQDRMQRAMAKLAGN